MVSEVDDPILSYISWQQTCSLTASTKSTFLNFLPHVLLSASSQSQLQVSQLPHWPHHLGLLCQGHSARLWLFQHILGARWVFLGPLCTYSWVHFQLPSLSRAIQLSSALCRTRSPLGPWSVRISFTMCCWTLQGNVLNLICVMYLQSFLQESEKG